MRLSAGKVDMSGSRRITMLLLRLGVPLSVLAAAAGLSCVFEPVDTGSHDEFVAEFDLVWQTVDQTYPGFAFSPVDWDESYQQYAPMADTVTTQLALVEIMAEMLAPLEEASTGFYPPGGDPLYPYTPDVYCNFDEDVLWQEYLDPAGFEWFQSPYWGGCMLDSTAYILISGWSMGFVPSMLDDFLDAHPGMNGVIIDIRLNAGSGSGQKIAEIGRRFNDVTRVGYFSVGRDGPGRLDLCDPVPRLVHTRSSWYQVPVAVLVGQNCARTTEEFACIASELPLVTLIGDTTQGQSSDYSSYSLPGNWAMTLPDSTILRADTTTWVHGNGVPPDIYVEATEEQFAQGIDPVLDYALDWTASQ